MLLSRRSTILLHRIDEKGRSKKYQNLRAQQSDPKSGYEGIATLGTVRNQMETVVLANLWLRNEISQQ